MKQMYLIPEGETTRVSVGPMSGRRRKRSLDLGPGLTRLVLPPGMLFSSEICICYLRNALSVLFWSGRGHFDDSFGVWAQDGRQRDYVLALVVQALIEEYSNGLCFTHGGPVYIRCQGISGYDMDLPPIGKTCLLSLLNYIYLHTDQLGKYYNPGTSSVPSISRRSWWWIFYKNE